MCSLNFVFWNSLVEELCTNEENNKAGWTLIFGGQCKYRATTFGWGISYGFIIFCCFYFGVIYNWKMNNFIYFWKSLHQNSG